MEELNATGHLAAPGFERQLLDEIRDPIEVHGRLVLAAGRRQGAHWSQNTWLRPLRIPIASVTDAAKQLRSIQRNWVLYSTGFHRRANLIQEQLPHVSAKALEFPAPAPTAPLGSWSLIARDCILASPECTSPFPNGEAKFVEFKEGPPTRAYLKLWEALTLLGTMPRAGDACLDAGCCPGGWTWALSRLGARVVAVDRAPLHPEVAGAPGVEYRRGSAFSIRPGTGERFDWIFSDVVCYPERLWNWVEAWLRSGECSRFVCTLKFQGDEHYGAIPAFAAVPGSRIVHLWSNKHELTWMLAR